MIHIRHVTRQKYKKKQMKATRKLPKMAFRAASQNAPQLSRLSAGPLPGGRAEARSEGKRQGCTGAAGRDKQGRQGASTSATIKMLPGMEFWHPGGTKNVDFSTAGPIVPCKRQWILNIFQDKNVAFSTAGPMVACNRHAKQRKSRCETYGRANGCM